MQTLTLRIEDSFMQEFLSFAHRYRDKIEIAMDVKIERDSYFFERQKELHQIRENIKNNPCELISFEEFEDKTKELEKELELKYAN